MRVARFPPGKEDCGASGEMCSDRRAGIRLESVTARCRYPPPPGSSGCARALAGQRAYHRVRFCREGCLREHSRSFAIPRSALHRDRPGSEECGAAAPLPGRDDACTATILYYRYLRSALASLLLRRMTTTSSEATRRWSITCSARTDINDDHEIITIIM